MTDTTNKTAPFNEIQGITSTNVPAYSNEDNDYLSFEGCYIHGIYTGFKWQCVEYARRWLLLRKSCIFESILGAADMWKGLKYIERVTDGRKFFFKNHPNGSPIKPSCDSLLIYRRGQDITFGHVAVICEVGEDYIRVAEQNYRFHYWPDDYSRQIPMRKHDGLYYIEDDYEVYGCLEIEDDDQLTPFDSTKIVLPKYQPTKPIGKLEYCPIPNNTCQNESEDYRMQSDGRDRSYIKADEDLFLNISSTSNDLYQTIKQATEDIILNDELLRDFAIPKVFWSRIRQSWVDKRDLDPIDHLDLKFDGKKLKLCPFRTENPLTLLQSTILEEKRIQSMQLDYDFTSSFQLHRFLVKNFKRLNIDTIVHILIDDNQEEMTTALFVKDLLREVDIDSKLCVLPDELYWKDSDVVDKDDQIVQTVWKMWKWETIFQDYNEEDRSNGEHPRLHDILLNPTIRIIEPIWKSITSHSIFLSVLLAMYPNILQDQWISPKQPSQMPFIDWSIGVQSNVDFTSYDSDDGFRTDDDIPQNEEHTSRTIVSWIINGVTCGFSIRDDQKQLIDPSSSLSYCCII